MFKHITKRSLKKLSAISSILTLSFAIANTASATTVEFQTSQGNFQVNLFDQTTPNTVNNFLNYVDSLHYSNSVIHRVAPGFVVQGGGFEFSGTMPLTRIETNAPVVNEAIYSNVKGTIAMAKVGGSINSATDQWFFNLGDNSENLDRSNGGFTAFGQVIGEGMTIVNKIAQLQLCNTNDNGGIPMVLDDGQKCADLTVPGIENFVVINHVIVIDSSEVTDSDLNPLLSKFPDSDGDGVKDIDDAFPSDPNKTVPELAENDAGSITWFSLMMIGLIAIRKRFINT
jgi:peptidyl-prolyl cis-trans isomerase A (cyclophilin A)